MIIRQYIRLVIQAIRTIKAWQGSDWLDSSRPEGERRLEIWSVKISWSWSIYLNYFSFFKTLNHPSQKRLILFFIHQVLNQFISILIDTIGCCLLESFKPKFIRRDHPTCFLKFRILRKRKNCTRHFSVVYGNSVKGKDCCIFFLKRIEQLWIVAHSGILLSTFRTF